MSENNNGTWWIWKVFIILSVVTTVEVILGIKQPAIVMQDVFGTTLLNYIFIILTVLKAYYIVSFFMHLGHEKKSFRLTVYLPALILIPYLTFIILMEGMYIFDVNGGIF